MPLATESIVRWLLLPAALTLPLCGYAQSTSRSQVGTTFQIAYGTVENVEVSRMETTTNAAKGAIVGGAIGLAAASHSNDARGAAGGALAGALIASLVAKHQRAVTPNAYTYTIALDAGGEAKIITDHGEIEVGDCVSLETGPSSNVRRVSDTLCRDDHREVLAHTDVHAAAHAEAEECHVAKEAVLAAETETDMDLAMKKVRVFCES